MKFQYTIPLTLIILLFALACKNKTSDDGPDWSKWGGPGSNFILEEALFDPATVAKKKVLWEIEVGKGYSAATVIGDRVYTMGYDKNKDTLYCLDITNGKTIWTYSYDSNSGPYTGTRASVVADGDRLYTISYFGIINCLNIRDGSRLWGVDCRTEYTIDVANWGISSSAVIVGDILLFNINKCGAAFNKFDGKPVWISDREKNGYATPVVFTYQGKTAAAMLGSKKVYVVDIATGALFWEYPWVTSYDVNAADPLIFDNKMFLTSSYTKGCVLLDISGEKPQEIWKNNNLGSHFTTPVYYKGYIYGSSDDANAGRGEFRCLDPADGKVLWSSGEINVNTFIIARGKCILLNQVGTLILAEAVPGGYQETLRVEKLLRPTCWTIPVLSKGRIFLRNDRGTLVCLAAR